MSKISIIIPVYNTEKFLAGCLDSILAQTFQNFEVICVNDGSTDNSLEILKKYANQDKRIKFFSQENQKQGTARNAGLDIATGDYIFFMDSDDQLPDYALALLLDIAQKTNAPITLSRKWIHTCQKLPKKISYKVHYNALKDFVNDPSIFSAPWNKLYRSDILKTHRFVPRLSVEDWPFLTTLFGQIDFYVSTDIPCYLYNEGNPSFTRSPFTQKKVDGYLGAIQHVYDFYKNRPDLPLAQKRMAVAIKMTTGKAYKTKDKELIHYTLAQLNNLFQKGIIKKHQLSLKTLFRLWKMQRMK